MEFAGPAPTKDELAQLYRGLLTRMGTDDAPTPEVLAAAKDALLAAMEGLHIAAQGQGQDGGEGKDGAGAGAAGGAAASPLVLEIDRRYVSLRPHLSLTPLSEHSPSLAIPRSDDTRSPAHLRSRHDPGVLSSVS